MTELRLLLTEDQKSFEHSEAPQKKETPSTQACCNGHCRFHTEARCAFHAVGLSHHTASIKIRSQVGFTPERIQELFSRLREVEGAECVALSTCNRTEIYSTLDPSIVEQMIADVCEVSLEDLAPCFYRKRGLCAASHLFRVASGLDSAVLGETEIVAQIKESWHTAKEAGMCGQMLNLVFQRALEASKRVRTETDLCKSATSISALAVREAISRSGELSSLKTVLVGAGKIAERLTKELFAAKVGSTLILNRTPEKATPLAELLAAHVANLDALEDALLTANLLFTAVSVTKPLLTSERLAAIMQKRHGERLLIIDLGVPSNIEVDVHLPGLEILNIDQLSATCAENSQRKEAALPVAQDILDHELQRLLVTITERMASPTIQALVEHGEAIRQFNLDWALERLTELDDQQRKVVEDLSRRMIKGLLSAPINQLKTELASEGDRAVIEQLFGLCPEDSRLES